MASSIPHEVQAKVDQHPNVPPPSTHCCGRLWADITGTTTSKCLSVLYVLVLIASIALIADAFPITLSNTAKLAIGISVASPLVLYLLYKGGQVLCSCQRKASLQPLHASHEDPGIPTFDILLQLEPNLKTMIDQGGLTLYIAYSFTSSIGQDKQAGENGNLNEAQCRHLIQNLNTVHALHAGKAQLAYQVQVVFKNETQSFPFNWIF